MALLRFLQPHSKKGGFYNRPLSRASTSTERGDYRGVSHAIRLIALHHMRGKHSSHSLSFLQNPISNRGDNTAEILFHFYVLEPQEPDAE
jgi:hypothetical protein